LLSSVVLVLLGCASEKPTNSVVSTPIYYNSTAPQSSAAAVKKASEARAHVWQPGSPHMFTDSSYSPPVVSLSTPVECPKCGLVKHECQGRKRRR
jgi:hypothetical protein